MPIYKYRCDCGKELSKMHGMSEDPEVKCECGADMRKIVTGGSGSFMKATTVGKYQKEERYRKKQRAKREIRQYERYGKLGNLVPNVAGQEVSSWKEAEALAKDRGVKDTSSFEPLKRKEENSKNSQGLDEQRIKKLKDKARQI